MTNQAICTSFAVALLALACGDAEAAVSVESNGPARECYNAARFDGSARVGITACSNALTLDEQSLEDHAATLINRGILRERVADLDGAISDYDAGLQLRPDLADAYVNRGAALLKMKRYKEAYDNLTKALAMGSQEPEVAYYDRGLVREHLLDFEGACDDYRHALAAQPNYALARTRSDICRFHSKPTSE